MRSTLQRARSSGGPFTDINELGSSNAMYDAGKLYVVDALGVLTQLDADTGAVGFQVLLPDEFFVESPPVTSDGVLFVTGGIDLGANLSAISEVDGTNLWTVSVEGSGAGAPTLSGTTVFATFPAQYYAFDRRTGATLWHFAGDVEGGGASTPVFRDGRLYVRDQEGRTQLPNSGVVLDDANGSAVASFECGPPRGAPPRR
ncbi:MAG TPA: PQQ-binding-like beta-propeller repeat protein [Myxococcales bacterium]|jgi:outer membrane protein assembly factor BamB